MLGARHCSLFPSSSLSANLVDPVHNGRSRRDLSGFVSPPVALWWILTKSRSRPADGETRRTRGARLEGTQSVGRLRSEDGTLSRANGVHPSENLTLRSRKRRNSGKSDRSAQIPPSWYGSSAPQPAGFQFLIPTQPSPRRMAEGGWGWGTEWWTTGGGVSTRYILPN